MVVDSTRNVLFSDQLISNGAPAPLISSFWERRKGKARLFSFDLDLNSECLSRYFVFIGSQLTIAVPKAERCGLWNIEPSRLWVINQTVSVISPPIFRIHISTNRCSRVRTFATLAKSSQTHSSEISHSLRLTRTVLVCLRRTAASSLR
jgi:hypothetical protein